MRLAAARNAMMRFIMPRSRRVWCTGTTRLECSFFVSFLDHKAQNAVLFPD